MYNLINKKIIPFKNLELHFQKIKKKKKKIVQCHGVFDIVHPGHLRHFAFCKSKGDILVVSLTADRHINKGLYRPLVPEQLRAHNLAAFEIIDYVIIDKFKYPYEILKKIKPNFFAKGQEYENKKSPLTQEESKIVQKFGGKIIFSPGDIVYSSTKIIQNSKPNISYDKLKLYLDYKKINLDDLKKIILNLKKIKVHVVGDLIIDTHTQCSVVGGLHKTPTLSVSVNSTKNYIGGAGAVASHFKSFTNKVELTSLISNDEIGIRALRDLKKLKIKVNNFIEDGRHTTNKNSYYVDSYKLLKVDKVSNETISQETILKILKILKKNKSDIVVFSDFRHGMFNEEIIKRFKLAMNKKIFLVADSQVASRWGNIIDFKNFDLITPTEKEARLSLLEQDMPIRPLADKILKISKAKNVILKLGDRGLISLDKNRKEYISLDPFVDKVIDSTGAGDALLAYSAASLYVTKSLLLSSIIGLLAACCKCEVNGNVPVSKEQILKKIDNLKKFF
jgi:rfaE bifunctional protein kinase chain/domain/rfaE bifunctional protein nucleotidyltransferase chain/domain